jgi:hypothetical protein
MKNENLSTWDKEVEPFAESIQDLLTEEDKHAIARAEQGSFGDLEDQIRRYTDLLPVTGKPEHMDERRHKKMVSRVRLLEEMLDRCKANNVRCLPPIRPTTSS